MKYRKKPVVIEALRFTLATGDEVAEWCKATEVIRDPLDRHAYLTIKTLEGRMTASLGDWIIKDVAGEFYMCKPEIFAATYEWAMEEEDGCPND